MRTPAASTTLTMPAANTAVTANYASIPTYSLTVVNGTGSGTYAAGTIVNIKANTAPSGQTFQNWTGATVANATSATTTLTMPAANTAVTANYTTVTSTYTLTVVNGTDSGSYADGTVVTITANAPPAGEAFQNWTGATVANAGFRHHDAYDACGEYHRHSQLHGGDFELYTYRVNGTRSGSYARHRSNYHRERTTGG